MNIQEKDIKDTGVVCWFYLYKKNENDEAAICGIVIIKQLIDKYFYLSNSSSSSVYDNKICFYTETYLTEEVIPDGSMLYKYHNDDLIKEFINTPPYTNSIHEFEKKNSNKHIIVMKNDLYLFLNAAITDNFNFDMFVNWESDDSLSSINSLGSFGSFGSTKTS